METRLDSSTRLDSLDSYEIGIGPLSADLFSSNLFLIMSYDHRDDSNRMQGQKVREKEKTLFILSIRHLHENLKGILAWRWQL